jgi:hypothetical protein
MPGIFEEVTLTWKGADYTVSPDRVMGLIATVEDVITLSELGRSASPKLAKLSTAYAVALRYAGCSVTSEEVYAACFSDAATMVERLVSSLLLLMIPPAELKEKMQKASEPTTGSAAKKKTTERQSKAHIRR